jgi:hypothetical protein
MTDLPHFSLPFRFGGPQAAVNEQDSIAEIGDCVLATLLCPLGFRVELPSFGVDDPTFSSPLVDTDEIRDVLSRWEPRALLSLDGELDQVDELVQHVQTIVRVRSQE